nr:Ku protein [Glutamicibacter sp.]
MPAEQIDPLMLEKSYYLQPDSKSPKAYELLRRTLQQTEKVAVVRFALRQKTRLGVLRVRSKTMVVQAVMWADEVRDAGVAAPEKTARISKQELAMSATLVEQYSSDFTPEDFEDDYQKQLHQLIEAKIEQGDGIDTEATFGKESSTEPGEVVDLMDALKRSIADRGKAQNKSTQGTNSKKGNAQKRSSKKKSA